MMRDSIGGDIVGGERVVPMGAMIRKYAPEGAGIDECDFEPLPIEIFDKTLGQTRKVLDFPCDERLGDAAMKVQTDVYVGRGVIGSADEWNNQLDRIALLRERYKTAVEDMESAAPAELLPGVWHTVSGNPHYLQLDRYGREL